MNRPQISQEALNSFIIGAVSFSKFLESRNGYSMSRELHDNELVERIDLVCEFLRCAHNVRIINLEMMASERHAKYGVHAIRHTASVIIGEETFIVPKGEGYSSEPFQPNVKIHSSRKFFADAVRHVGNMAKAIKHEAERPQTSQRITAPYWPRISEWQPAKLAA